MNQEQIKDRIKRLIASLTGVPIQQIDDNDDLFDYNNPFGFDSLLGIQFIVGLEEFSVEIDDDLLEFENFHTVNATVDIVHKLLSKVFIKK